MTPSICKSRWIPKLLFAVCVIGVLSLIWQPRISSNCENLAKLDEPPSRAKKLHTIPESSCTAQNSFTFMKIHKTGSSSILNMCLRYAISHDLIVAIPRSYNYFGHPKPFNKSMVNVLKDGLQYNVFTHHTRFNYKNLQDFMPEDTMFFTLLREPASLFESAYAFFFMESLYKMTLEEFVSHNKSAVEKLSKRVINGRIGRNQMAFDLGVEVDQFENEEEITKIAEILDQQIHLVMIRERMNESLVLLKHLLCWTTDDVVVLHMNARAEKVKKKLTPELSAKILYWNNADKILYDYFSKRLDEKIKAFGVNKMKKEVQELKTRIEHWQSYCIAGVIKDASAYSNNIEGFKLANVHNKTCEYLTTDEMKFTNQLRKQQEELLNGK